jgi:hypothetical protein
VRQAKSSGVVQWARLLGGGTGTDQLYTLISDPSASGIMGMGSLGSSSITLGSTTLTNTATAAALAVKYDASGSLV